MNEEVCAPSGQGLKEQEVNCFPLHCLCQWAKAVKRTKEVGAVLAGEIKEAGEEEGEWEEEGEEEVRMVLRTLHTQSDKCLRTKDRTSPLALIPVIIF